ncbi:hypothetical protein QR680_017918 [Steinernema hermaphroditum]|uniref:Uncharacterized protein n=1 Tax=Steinernema hermaphroditum TaxID=289476 RepID=A0AA39HIN5_9BILA|nr:hypothetical protein QR680_017918 [Steinernema hermaphroditum]
MITVVTTTIPSSTTAAHSPTVSSVLPNSHSTTIELLTSTDPVDPTIMSSKSLSSSSTTTIYPASSISASTTEKLTVTTPKSITTENHVKTSEAASPPTSHFSCHEYVADFHQDCILRRLFFHTSMVYGSQSHTDRLGLSFHSSSEYIYCSYGRNKNHHNCKRCRSYDDRFHNPANSDRLFFSNLLVYGLHRSQTDGSCHSCKFENDDIQDDHLARTYTH